MISQLDTPPLAAKDSRQFSIVGRVRLAVSTALVALLVFAGINFASRSLLSQQADNDGAVYTVRRFCGRNKAPDTVFMGSSLAKHVCASLDSGQCQRSNVANLAYNLQRLSDSYLLVEQLLKGKNKPKRVVLLLGPRDFFDNDATAIYRTSTFKQVTADSTFIRFFPLYATSVSDLACVVFERASPMFSRRIGLQERAYKIFKHIYAAVGLPVSELHAPATRQAAWQRSLDEYKWRYQGISVDRMSVQIAFLQRIFQLCKQRDVQVVIVNLPLSRDNENLLPNGFSDEFRHMLRDQCQRCSGTFIDAEGALKLDNEDFDDCAHLNKAGGRAVLALIAEQTSATY